MRSVGNIYLSWRKSKGFRRIIVGVIRRDSALGVQFRYLKRGVEAARKDGFTCYTDFPDISKVYSENVLESFGQRLINTGRADVQRFFDFWCVDSTLKEDKFYMLAQTQGILSTDNFEFLAVFYPTEETLFISEISGLSKSKLAPGTIEDGELLTWELDSKNDFDKYAVKVLKDGKLIGYVKKIHSRIFYKKNGDRLKITVRHVDQNGSINRVFIKISNA